jgi:DNA (cytosine-5)-methyltransferase 1
MIDAVHFVPQSRPRLFIIAVDKKVEIPRQLMAEAAQDAWYTHALRSAHARLPTPLKRNWIWWRLPPPPRRDSVLADVIEAAPRDVRWRPAAETQKMLSMMSEVNLAKVQNVQATGARAIGTVYKRMRVENGVKVQRAEVRFDQTSGCLRTPAGGSSRQSILVVEGDSVRSRLLSAREAARLMGLPDSYQLPPKYTEAYHVAGDGLTIPVVEWLERHLLHPLANTIHSEVIPSCPDSCSCCSPQPVA